MGQMNDIIGSNPLAGSLSRRGIPLGILARMSPGAAGFQPDLQTPPYPPMPDKTPHSIMGPLNVPNPTIAPQPQNPVPVQAPGTTPNAPLTSPVVGSTAPKNENVIMHPYEGEASGIIRILGDRLDKITAQEIKERKKSNGQQPT